MDGPLCCAAIFGSAVLAPHSSPASRRTAIMSNRFAGVAGMVAMVALIGSGCSSSGVDTNGREYFHITTPSDAVEAPTATSGTETVPAPPASQPSTPPGTTPGTLKIGQAAIITIDGTEAASLTIASVQASTRPADVYGSAPRHGNFLTVRVRAVVLPSYRNGFDIGPMDFYALLRSSYFEEGNGNALDAPGADRELDYATLNAGESTSGTLVFDVPAKHGKIAYVPQFGDGPMGYWTF
jgi:hypothetical protein